MKFLWLFADSSVFWVNVSTSWIWAGIEMANLVQSFGESACREITSFVPWSQVLISKLCTSLYAFFLFLDFQDSFGAGCSHWCLFISLNCYNGRNRQQNCCTNCQHDVQLKRSKDIKLVVNMRLNYWCDKLSISKLFILIESNCLSSGAFKVTKGCIKMCCRKWWGNIHFN